MFQERNLEEKMQYTHHQMNEFLINLEKLDRDYQYLLNEIGLTPEQIQTYINNQNNFSSSVWETLQTQRKTLDEKLDLTLKGIPNANETKKTFSEKASIQQHWLFVR